MNLTETIQYSGEKQPSLEEFEQDGLLPYLPSKELIRAVNLTLFLEKRPLLLKGDPGSGKTRLARAVAYELGLPYYAWHIKSTSRARDGLYTYDAIHRLHDAQLDKFRSEESLNSSVIDNYIKFGPLGLAFKNEKRAVLLIDEIDKADIDFPNDLLLELDEQRFFIEETGSIIKAKNPPIVFITSNDEKSLPDAFLRRCLFFYLDFPSPVQLVAIVGSHFPSASSKLIEAAVTRFTRLRNLMDKEKGKTGKKASTSELLDWFSVLNTHAEDEILSQLKGQLPYAEVLLKNWEDHLRYLGNNSEE